MSFDLRIRGGDLVVGNNGDFEQVEGTAKLIQDVLKLLLTPLGGNIFYPWYGSLVTKSLVGQAFDFEFLSNIASNQVQTSLETIQRLQSKQSLEQRVTPFEQIAAVKSVKIERNRTDPRFFTVSVEIASRALSVTQVDFTVDTMPSL